MPTPLPKGASASKCSGRPGWRVTWGHRNQAALVIVEAPERDMAVNALQAALLELSVVFHQHNKRTNLPRSG